MSGFIEGESRSQAMLFPERIDDYIAEGHAVRVIDVFADELGLSGLGFKTIPAVTRRPAYHPAMMLKLYIHGYLNRIQSSRRLEREAERNVELMWLTGRLPPDFKTSADGRDSEASHTKTDRLENKIAALKDEIQAIKKLRARILATPDQQISLTDPGGRAIDLSVHG